MGPDPVSPHSPSKVNQAEVNQAEDNPLLVLPEDPNFDTKSYLY